jgi:hypothetical protein
VQLTRTVAALVVAVAVAGCSAPADRQAPPPPPPPPLPPAACLLDTAALAAATGVGWAPDASTASDTRCVYDPAASPRPPEGPVFLAVEVTPAGEPAVALDTVAEVCEDDSRVAAVGDQAGFVCRIQGGSVFAATARDGQVVTLAASAVPSGTTAARLVMAFDQQLGALRR